MATPLLSARELSIHFSDVPLWDDVTFHVYERDHISLIGQNGCGKSTLLKVLAHELEHDKGDLFYKPHLKVSYLPQNVHFSKEQKVLDYVLSSGCEDYLAQSYLHQLAIDPEKDCATLSGGERRRVSLAKVLCTKADIYLLDEPTNHLDILSIQWLEQELALKTFIVISHDRTFLKNITNRMLWMDQGTLRESDRGFAHFDTWQEEIEEKEKRQLEKMNTHLKQELHWLQRGVTARRKRNQGRLKALHQLREARRQHLQQMKTAPSLGAIEGDMKSKLVFNAYNISKKYGDKPLIQNFSTRMIRGDKIGIIGANGTGKTTFLKLLLGLEEPDQGIISRGANVEVIYFDQMKSTLKEDKTLWENLCETGGSHVTIGGKERHVVAYLKDFMFDDKQAKSVVSILSGGQKNRLALAKALTKNGNVLVLDEPTNDLDMDTLDLLQDMLSEYQGTLLIVSHDRDFLDHTVNSIIAMEGEGMVYENVGGYSDYLEKRQSFFQKHLVKKVSPKEKSGKEVASFAPKEKLKLSFHEKRDLELLPKDMDALTKRIQDIEKELGASDLFLKNPVHFQKLSDELEKVKHTLFDKEERYLELLMLEEALSS
jgi:ATP-binding cassette subfamily F protein uup